MHLKYFSLVFIVQFLYSDFALTQENLVPNGSFEEYIQCPNSTGQINMLTFWTSPNTASPDFFNTCAQQGNVIDVPNNIFAYQNPKSGDGYAGIILYDGTNNSIEYREYLQVELISTLIANENYKLSFFFSKSDKCIFSASNFGAFLTSTEINTADYLLLNNQPQITNNSANIINDTSNWIFFEETYQATGGEKYLILGNFLDNTNTNLTIENYGTIDISHILIDDIVFELNNQNIIDETHSNYNIFYMSGKTLHFNKLDYYNINIINSVGQKIIESSENNINLNFLPSGIYYLNITDKLGNIFKQKIIF
jgi:hypothetical protein